MIRKFKVEATRVDEYIIELDDEVINEEWMKEYSKYFHDVDNLEEIAKTLAFCQMRLGDERFFEGFGNVNRNSRLPFSTSDFDAKGNLLPEDQRDKAEEGINIVVITEDDDYSFEVEEVTL